VIIMTPEVVNPRFSYAIAGEVSRRKWIKTKKATRKWLAFNDFSSGGRCAPKRIARAGIWVEAE
jgi:hypothetical protein